MQRSKTSPQEEQVNHKRRKKRTPPQEEHENHERWLVSYADFITLLFAFFVTMYAVSRADGTKMGSALESFQKALGSVIPVALSHKEPGVFPDRDVPIQFSITSPIEGKAFSYKRKALEALASEIKGEMEKISIEQIKFILEERGLVIRISEGVLFRSGEASIREEMKSILNVLGQTFERISYPIRVEGHTDNVPINTLRFPSNWELSTERATTIVRYLLSHLKLDPERISASGYAEFRPIASNDTPEGRVQNRRVDFVILDVQEEEMGEVGTLRF